MHLAKQRISAQSSVKPLEPNIWFPYDPQMLMK